MTMSRNPRHRHATDGEPAPVARLIAHTSAACVQAQYLVKQEIWYGWQQSRLGADYDIPDSQFWDRFGEVPSCNCPGRPRLAPITDYLTPNRQQGFRLSFGPTSVFVWRSLRTRLRRLVAKEMRVNCDMWDLDQLAPAAGRTPTRVLDALRKFEGRRH